MDYLPLTGFKTKCWPLDTSIIKVFNNFANRNNMFASLYNATVLNSTTDKMQNIIHYIQVSYYKISNYIIDDIFCPVFHFSKLDTRLRLDNGYADSIDEYFSLCTKYECAFCGWYDANNNKQKITNAENALVEYDLHIKNEY